MADVKLSAAQKRALEKFTPGEVRTTVGLNSSTLEALETRCLVVRGKAALDTSWSNRAKHILVEAVAITAAGYETLTGEVATAEVIGACDKAALRLSLGLKADPVRLWSVRSILNDGITDVRERERRIDALRKQIAEEEAHLAYAKQTCDEALAKFNAAKVERADAARQYEALTGLTLLAGPGEDEP
jgi:hypothetical protein